MMAPPQRRAAYSSTAIASCTLRGVVPCAGQTHSEGKRFIPGEKHTA